MSDWWAQHSGVASAFAGLDMSMAGDQGLGSGNTYWGNHLTEAVLNGTIPQWRLDDMVTRIMAVGLSPSPNVLLDKTYSAMDYYRSNIKLT